MRRKVSKVIRHGLGWLIGIYMLLGAVFTAASPASPGTSDLEMVLGNRFTLAIFGVIIGWAALMLLYSKARKYGRVEHDSYLAIAMINFFILLMEWFVFHVPPGQWIESLIILAISTWLYLRN
jgi:hypothetical protein